VISSVRSAVDGTARGGPSMTPESGGSEHMADNSFRSQHSNGSHGRDSAASGPNDPLAELARLIGQNDPFADFGRNTIRVGHADDGASGQRTEPHVESAASDTYQTESDEHARDEHYAADDGDETLHREEIYDDPPRARRRGGLVTVMAVAGLAVLGTAGAFGYRTISSPSGPATPPPVIRADTTPSKIVPAVGTNEQQSNKLIQDRVGSQGERIVSREEQPIEIRDSRPARSVFPPVNVPNSTASVPANPWPTPPATAPQPTPASAAANEPKKVRTVPVKPDQPDPSARPAGAPAPTRVSGPAASAADSSLPTPGRPTAAGRPAGDGTAPMSLSPQNAAPEPPAGRPQRTALAPNPPAQPAAAPASGTYVQVSSQRTETDAQASFKALQAKYPAVLGGKQAVVRRAELGDKGVYYRAMVGPFSVEQAAELCGSLKAAGGQCIVQRN
jgi:SPOR domain